MLPGGDIVSLECANCGWRPERDQPAGIQSDGVLRDMVDPGFGQDMGGNPLQEGILADGGWQNRKVRDESFASVRSASVSNEMSDTLDMNPYMPWEYTAAANFAVTPGQRAGIHNGTVRLLQFLDASVNGLSARDQGQEIVMTYSPFNREGWESIKTQPVDVSVPYDEYIPAAQEIIEGSLQPSSSGEQIKILAQRMKAGEVPFPPGINPDQVQAHVLASFERKAFWGAAAKLLAPAVKPLVQRAVGTGGSVLPKAWGAAKGYAAMHGAAGLLGLGGSPAASGPVGGGETLRGYQQLAHTASVILGFEHPSTVPEIGTGGDPEQVDPHEFNDGASTTNPYDPTVNDQGGTDSYDDQTIEQFVDALDDLLTFAEDERSGLENPKIRAIHEILESRDPGYAQRLSDLPDFPLALSHAATVANGYGEWGNMQQVPFGNAPQGLPAGNTGLTPNPAVGGRCPGCNGVLTANGGCPQCGIAQQANPGIGQMPQTGVQPMANTKRADMVPGDEEDWVAVMGQEAYDRWQFSDEAQRESTPGGASDPDEWLSLHSKTADHEHQGPRNSEQFAAVAELLTQEGRGEEIVAMLREPWNYADELARVQNKPDMPPIDESKPQQAIEEAPPGDTMPVQPLMTPSTSPAQMGMAAALKHIGADSVAPRCPRCDSSTTGVMNESGECRCHRCGNEWKTDNLIEDKTATDREYAPSHGDLHADGNPVDLPAADQDVQRDIREEQDSGRTWVADGGEPLQVGSEYEMHSDQYSIPDIVRIEAVKPDGIDVTVVGEYSARGQEDSELSYRHQISRQEAELEHLTFKPTEVADQDEGIQKNDDVAMSDDPRPGPGEITDLSRPHSSVESTIGQEPHPTHPVPRQPLQNEFLQTDREPAGWVPAVEAPYLSPDATPEEHAEWKQLHQEWLEQHHNPAMVNYENSRPEMQAEQGTSSLPSDHVLGWQPGQKGRGIFINDKLHTWPVTPTPDDPQGGLMHSEYLSQFGDASDYSPGFEIEPDGTMVELGSMDRYPAETVDPRLKRDQGNYNFAHVEASEAKEPIDPALAWLAEDSDPVEFDTSRTAGARFSPSEQRGFIDEEGTARNADKLNLTGTHYEVQFDAKARPDRVDEEHLFLGL